MQSIKLYLQAEQRLIGDSTQYCILAYHWQEAVEKALQGARSTLCFCFHITANMFMIPKKVPKIIVYFCLSLPKKLSRSRRPFKGPAPQFASVCRCPTKSEFQY